MALTITPTPITGSFGDFTYNFILRSESLVRRIYTDGRGVPTLGVGYALVIKDSQGTWVLRENLDADLASIGIVLSPADRQRLTSVLEALNGGNPAAAQALIPIYQAGEDSAAKNVFSFPLISADPNADGRTLFNRVIDEYVQTVRQRLGIMAGSAFDTSLEMTALISLSFNLPALIGPKLTAAFQLGDRASVWYEIRYGSNGGKIDRQGIANRRYRESDMFGLYNDITNVGEEEAKNVLSVYTRNRTTIFNYDAQFVPTNVNAQSLNINDKLVFADRVLIGLYGSGVAIEEARGRVLVGTAANDTTTLVGGDQSDLIFGEGGNDVLNGRAGDNVLYGGVGNDDLFTGAGNSFLFGNEDRDSFFVYGTGNHRIVDPDPGTSERIFFKTDLAKGDTDKSAYSPVAGLFIQDSNVANTWRSPDGQTTITQNSPTTITGANGFSVTVDNFQSGDFGVQLKTLPADEPTTRTIVGDLEPVDFDPAAPGVQTQTDDLGNLVTDPNVPAPNRADTLRGSAGADLIQSGGGNDTVTAGAGGDQVQAGSGRDIAFGEAGNDVLEGGADDDYLDRGEGNDALVGGEGRTNYGVFRTTSTRGLRAI